MDRHYLMERYIPILHLFLTPGFVLLGIKGGGRLNLTIIVIKLSKSGVLIYFHLSPEI
jgi:hypothetical protein